VAGIDQWMGTEHEGAAADDGPLIDRQPVGRLARTPARTAPGCDSMLRRSTAMPHRARCERRLARRRDRLS
jgi:hypothetical protein